MFDWNLLLDEGALASVLPGDYARFARPVRDGLAVFLEGLPPAHQAEILERQAALPPTADISERLAALARCCPVLHKLGQVLARDQRLAPVLRRQLRTLESLAPTVPEAVIREAVERELGPLEQVGVRLRFPALAEASVAVVVPFAELVHKRGLQLHGGVLKVLKPGIEERLALELDLLGQVGVHLDEECEQLGIPSLDYAEIFEQIRDKLRHEVDLGAEQRNLARAAGCYADEPAVKIPAVLSFCTPRMTAMERVTGGKVTDHRPNASSDGRQLARQVVQSLIGHPLFSLAGEAMFHGDPHAGNLFWTDDNRLAILDWSLVGSLGEFERVVVIQILLAAAMLDSQRLMDLLASLDKTGQLDRAAAAAVVAQSLKQIRGGAMLGVSWIVGLLDELVVKARLRAATDLLLFRKTLHTLEGVVAEIGNGELRIDDVLLADFCRHFTRELPRRWRASPTSREFATRLSNIDLTRAVFESPAAVARYWTGKALDLLDACNATGKLRV